MIRRGEIRQHPTCYHYGGGSPLDLSETMNKRIASSQPERENTTHRASLQSVKDFRVCSGMSEIQPALVARPSKCYCYYPGGSARRHPHKMPNRLTNQHPRYRSNGSPRCSAPSADSTLLMDAPKNPIPNQQSQSPKIYSTIAH
jgi:hypothetical protein